MPIYVKLFNLILRTGVFPEAWTVGIIIPIFKNKGSTEDPDNYRGITLLSCLGKLFTSVINNRLKKYMENLSLLGEEQAGFRAGYSTTDHIFTLKCIIDIFLSKKKKLFAAFIDYRKAFDNVWRVGLWQKLLNHNVNGKILKVIYSLYNQVKSCVRLRGTTSSLFGCNVGVRQGENLSPLLFAIFLNDMNEFISHSYNGLILSDAINPNPDDADVALYLKLYLLLYADDTIVLAESEAELQAALHAVQHYRHNWKLEINVDKTKIVVFSRGKIRNIPKFTYNNQRIEVAFEFKYLGIVFSYNGTFHLCKKTPTPASRKSYVLIIKKE